MRVILTINWLVEYWNSAERLRNKNFTSGVNVLGVATYIAICMYYALNAYFKN